jgi:hypothetical protein
VVRGRKHGAWAGSPHLFRKGGVVSELRALLRSLGIRDLPWLASVPFLQKPKASASE